MLESLAFRSIRKRGVEKLSKIKILTFQIVSSVRLIVFALFLGVTACTSLNQEPQLSPAPPITGCVTDPQGRPIADAMVDPDILTPGVPVHLIGISTIETGCYTIGNLYAGSYDIRVVAASYLPATAHVDLVAGGPPVRLDFVLEPYR